MWTKIPVPSNWEQQGFGDYNYGGDKISEATPRANEQGKYRYKFDVPSDWKEKNVRIVFDASMTDTEVWINGKSAGAVHQGAFYRFKYDITPLLKFGESNLLEVTVSKNSANESVIAPNDTLWITGFSAASFDLFFSKHRRKNSLTERRLTLAPMAVFRQTFI